VALLAAVAGCGVPPEVEVACSDLQQTFTDELFTPVISKTCVSCHNPDGVAQATRMVYPVGITAAEAYPIFRKMAQVKSQGEPLVLLKPSGQMSHAGGTVFAKDSMTYAQFESVVSGMSRCGTQ